MARAAKPSKPAGSRVGPMLTGLIFGVFIGLLMAGAVAWYILTKSPDSFVSEAQHEAPKAPVVAVPPEAAKPASAPATASGVADGKPRFEFYKVLDGKSDGTANVEPAAKQPAAVKPPVAAQQKGGGMLQAGAFQKQDDAEKLKAKLALLGLEASIQSAAVPEKGTWYRVRLGPFTSTSEMDKALAVLKQNGMNATPVHAQ